MTGGVYRFTCNHTNQTQVNAGSGGKSGQLRGILWYLSRPRGHPATHKGLALHSVRPLLLHCTVVSTFLEIYERKGDRDSIEYARLMLAAKSLALNPTRGLSLVRECASIAGGAFS